MEVPKSTSDKYLSFQTFLDENQYTRKSILSYERIFGDSYISTGGRQTTEEFCATLNLKSGQSVLDVGCGIGGSAFYMAKHFGVSVHGVDLSSNMITIALERQTNFLSENKVSFEISDITQQEYEENSFNLIYSRDTILHIKNKELLFSRFKSWLKPGGKVLISDYCQGAQHHSDEFANYVQQRGYHLLTVQQYGRLLEAAGFEIVLAEDRTKQFIEILQTEVSRFEKNKTDFIKDFDEEEYQSIVDGWRAKIRRCQAGDQCWGLFTATKASS